MLPLNHTRARGKHQEARACRFLKKNGLQLLERNFSCRFGEIDLVMLHPPRQLVFVEVRYRKSAEFGTPMATVTAHKQQKIRRTAALYLMKHQRYQAMASRFDVVAIHPGPGGKDEIAWIRHAFY